jgi:hypothetical protein
MRPTSAVVGSAVWTIPSAGSGGGGGAAWPSVEMASRSGGLGSVCISLAVPPGPLSSHLFRDGVGEWEKGGVSVVSRETSPILPLTHSPTRPYKKVQH